MQPPWNFAIWAGARILALQPNVHSMNVNNALSLIFAIIWVHGAHCAVLIVYVIQMMRLN